MDASVILPLYVFPSAGAWDPVFEMYALPVLGLRHFRGSLASHQPRASSYPRVQFTAIVNPNNGPGEAALPNEDYSQAIETLNGFDNVRTVGYVATTWCMKNLSSVLDEVAAYSGWGGHGSSLAMSGIVFDETPTQYSAEYALYLQTISQAVHESHGLKDGYVGMSDPLHFGIGAWYGSHHRPKPVGPILGCDHFTAMLPFRLPRFCAPDLWTEDLGLGSCMLRG